MFEDLNGFRHEYKYIEPEGNLIAVQTRLGTVMKKDVHAGDKGFYSIRSLYFDDHYDTYINQNIDGVDERAKWRIRIYDQNSEHISLERKIRKSDMIRKQSCDIDIGTYEDIIAGKARISASNPELFNMFVSEIKTRGLKPAVIVEYDRTPFVHSAGRVRVTIDRNIRSSSDIDGFLEDRGLASRPVLPAGANLIEVKFDTFLPDHIAHCVEHGRMRRETFSKYYMARKFPFGRKHI